MAGKVRKLVRETRERLSHNKKADKKRAVANSDTYNNKDRTFKEARKSGAGIIESMKKREKVHLMSNTGGKMVPGEVKRLEKSIKSIESKRRNRGGIKPLDMFKKR